jgi:hypothetical protein
VLDAAEAVLPTDYQITLLADREFDHGKLIRRASMLREDSPNVFVSYNLINGLGQFALLSDLKITFSNASKWGHLT